MRLGQGCKLIRGTSILILVAVLVVCLCFQMISPLPSLAIKSGQNGRALEPTLARMPLHFIENKGQMDLSVRYYERGLGHEMFFTQAGIVFSITGPTSSSYVRLIPEGMSEGLNIMGGEPQPSKVNVFQGNSQANWRTNIPTYGSVMYQGVWPGVDLKFYGNNQHLEYDIVVKSGGDPAQVAFRYDGIAEATLTESGDLTIFLEAGATLVQKKPVAYQQIGGKRVERQARFKIIEAPSPGKCNARLIYGFDVAAYDQGHELIIDPVLVFSTYLGGGGLDVGIEVATDAFGNTIIAGLTQSTDFPTTPNSYDPHYNGGLTDIFITKIDKTGRYLIYSTYLGGNNIELDQAFEDGQIGELYNFGLAVDKNGDIFVATNTRSADFPTTQNAYSRTLRGIADAVVVKLKATGDELVYSTFLGGSGWDEAGGIAVDANGNAYIAGGTKSTNFPTTEGAYRRIPYGREDIFVTKLSPAGNRLVYSTYLGGSAWDESTAIAIDQSGNAYILGGGDSSDFPTKNAFDRSFNGPGYDIYLTKLNRTGTQLVYSTFLGGSGEDWAEGLAIDGLGNAYIAGCGDSPNYPVTQGAFDVHLDEGDSGCFLAKMAPSGSQLVYFTFVGPAGGMGVNVDGKYNVIYTGAIGGGLFSSTADAYVAKFNPSGSKLLYSSSFGGSDFDAAYAGGTGGVIDSKGNFHFSGLTRSTDFPTKSAFQSNYGGGEYDAFVAKISGLASSPTVSISPTDPTASEPGTDRGRFTVHRSGGIASRLVVKYSTGGTAANGTDYRQLSGSVVIPPNSHSADIVLVPIDDTILEGIETVELTVVKTPSYVIGAQSSATVDIIDND